MIKIKKVLLALDYDPGAQKLAEISHSMAKVMNDKVVLLHVVSGPMYFLKIGNNGAEDPELIQPHLSGEEQKASQYFLILGK